MAVTTYWGRIKSRIKEKGVLWTVSDYFHKLKVKRLEKSIIDANKSDLEKGEKAIPIDLPTHTIEENRRRWETHDWSKRGDEWSERAQKNKGLDPKIWKETLIEKMMLKYIKNKGIIFEIGPGGGRWTETLQKLGERIIIADITERCLEMCKERFKSVDNIEYKLIKKRLDFLEDNSIDYVWAYDVFTHMNPSDIETYLKEIKCALRPGGYAIIHHSGTFSDYKNYQEGYHSLMGKKQFALLVEKYEMKIIEQNDELAHENGDVVSVFIKP